MTKVSLSERVNEWVVLSTLNEVVVHPGEASAQQKILDNYQLVSNFPFLRKLLKVMGLQ